MKRALYVVVRADLPIGQQMAQLGHAAHEFGRTYPNRDVGETIVVLSAPSENALLGLLLEAHGVLRVPFHEPDLGGALTAVAFDGAAQSLLSRLPLAGRVTQPAA